MTTAAPDVCITEFTDPGCPWAWSAEPFRRRLQWLYGDKLDWGRRMVVLSDSPQDYADKGLTPEKMAAGAAKIAREHGMPIDTSVRPRLHATAPACRAIVAARLRAPDAEDPLLRAFRVRNFAGQLLDEPQTLEGAAADAGLDAAQLGTWMQEAEVEAALEEDRAAAREPIPAARVLDEKLANWSGGRRYTCPSYEIVRRSDGVRIAVPGFQPFAAYDVVLANLVPGSERRDPPSSVLEVLDWAGEPLATREVAVTCDIGHDEAREQLGRVAVERHLGFDGLWTPA
ncbi:MAG TPA: DsbA family protein [Solirubrobacteraceae bacterium]|nr:DsbA family protein [Solirubrobacteraceae bacterium]